MSPFRFNVVVVMMLAMTTVISSSASGWTPQDGQFREVGGNDGRKADAGVHASGGEVRFTTPIGQETVWFGGMVIDDGRVFAVSVPIDNGSGRGTLSAVDATTGALLWEFEETPVDGNCVAVGQDGTVWAATRDPDLLLGFNPADGSIRMTADATFQCDTGGLHILPGNQAVMSEFCCSGQLHLIDLDDGSRRAVPTGGSDYGTKVLFVSDDGRRVYTDAPQAIVSVDVATGQELDRFDVGGTVTQVMPARRHLHFPGDLIVLGFSDRVTALRDTGDGTLETAWETELEGVRTLTRGGQDGDRVLVNFDGSRRDTTVLDVQTGEVTGMFELVVNGNRETARLVDADGNYVSVSQGRGADPAARIHYDVFAPDGTHIGEGPAGLGGITATVMDEAGTLYLGRTVDGSAVITAVDPGGPMEGDTPSPIDLADLDVGVIRAGAAVVANVTNEGPATAGPPVAYIVGYFTAADVGPLPTGCAVDSPGQIICEADEPLGVGEEINWIVDVAGDSDVGVAANALTRDPDLTNNVAATAPGDPALMEAYFRALRLSRLRFEGSGGFAGRAATAAHVVVARLDVFADALTGSVLTRDGSLVYTDRDALAPEAAAEIDRLLGGNGTVYLLGGTAALSAAVESAVESAGYTAVRLSGPSRVETALAVADQAEALYGPAATVAVARSDSPADNPTAAWADSISAGGWAAFTGQPLLLTPTGSAHPAVQAWLAARQARVVVLGGTAAVGESVATDLDAGTRVAGPNRFATAVAIAEELWGSDAGPGFLVGNGVSDTAWQENLAAAGLSADAGFPLLLTNPFDLPAETGEALGCPRPTVSVVGGPRLVAPGLRDILASC